MTRRILLGLVYVLILVLVLAGIARIIAFMNEGADRKNILFVPQELKTSLPDIQMVDNGNEGIAPLDITLEQFKKDYIHALDALSKARESNDLSYLEDHFTDEIIEMWNQHFISNAAKGIFEKTLTLSHEIDIHFHSLDRSVIVFKDREVELYQELYKGDVLIHRELEVLTYENICVLEDGRWRIASSKVVSTDSEKPQHYAKTEQLQLEKLKGLNYYPQAHPWDLLNVEIDLSVYQADMNHIKSLNGNAIRIFLQYEDMGGPAPDKFKLERLEQFLDIAHLAEIKVILTLFDFYGDYSLSDWRATDQHLRILIQEIKHHPAILAYDLKNEPDLDFENRGQALVLDWLSHKSDLIHKLDPNHPVTIGWSTPEAGELLSDKLDFVSFHYYGKATNFKDRFAALSNQTNKPILLSEYGLSSYRGIWNPVQFSEKKQAKHFESMTAEIENLNLGQLAWTLYDFKSVPKKVVGKRPWRRAYQQHYGLVDDEGQWKPAAHFFAN